jgi:hypothetical protein
MVHTPSSSSSKYPKLSLLSWPSIHCCGCTNLSTVAGSRRGHWFPWFPRHIFDAHTAGLHGVC